MSPLDVTTWIGVGLLAVAAVAVGIAFVYGIVTTIRKRDK